MESLWNDAEAAQFGDDLGLRVYSSRLLGRDKSLVLHGGGNTSVKLRERNLLGDEEDLLYVKGSGWDLEFIEAAGFSPVRLSHLRRLAGLEVLSDPEMVNQLVTQMTRASAPTPSVETILHAILPHKYVDHTHADAVLSVTNTADGEARIREIYGNQVVVVPYIMPGFDLARLCALLFPREAGPRTIGMVLMNHGVFSFGASARESYERMIQLVQAAEDYLARRRAWALPAPAGEVAAVPLRSSLAALRREISGAAGFPLVMRCHHHPRSLAFARRPDVAAIAQGPATPDHAIRTKQLPMIGRDVSAYVSAYRSYFDAHAPGAKEKKTILDAAPRVVLDPELGMCTAGPHGEGRGHRRRPVRSHHGRDRTLPAARGLPRAAGEGHLRRRVLGSRAGQAAQGREAAGVHRRSGAGHRCRVGHRQGLRRSLARARRRRGRSRRQPRRYAQLIGATTFWASGAMSLRTPRSRTRWKQA